MPYIICGQEVTAGQLQASTENFNKISWVVVRFVLCYFSVEAFIVNTCKYTKLFWGKSQGRVRLETNVLETFLSSLGSVQGKTARWWFSVSESSSRMLLPNFCSGQLESRIRLSGCTMLLDLETDSSSVSLCVLLFHPTIQELVLLFESCKSMENNETNRPRDVRNMSGIYAVISWVDLQEWNIALN